MVGDGDAVEPFLDRGLQDSFDPVSPVRKTRMDVEVEPEEAGLFFVSRSDLALALRSQLQTSLGSVIVPSTAVAAAVAGDAR
ncbi:MAG TPA: hypothetical protein PLQ49_09745 [Methanothrix sp.]|nr:hypothetical protein [Methanothrix sp.]HRW83242.1 hypothetical protein [Methanothrix sp.]